MTTDSGPDGTNTLAPRTLIRAPEFECTLWRGVLFGTYRTNVRSAFLPRLRQAISEAREENGAPLTVMSIHQLDRRFPLAIDFAANVEELTATLRELRTSVSAVAVVIDFDGIFASTLEGYCKLIGATVPQPASKAFRSRVLAMHWLLPHVRHPGGAATFERYLAIPPPRPNR